MSLQHRPAELGRSITSIKELASAEPKLGVLKNTMINHKMKWNVAMNQEVTWALIRRLVLSAYLDNNTSLLNLPNFVVVAAYQFAYRCTDEQ